MLKKLGVQDRALRENTHKAKQDFLRQWILEDASLSPQLILKRGQEYGIRLDAEKAVQVLLLRIDHYKAFCRQYEFADRSLLRYGMMNIATEILAGFALCEAVDSGDDHVVFVVQGLETHELELGKGIQRIQQEFARYLKLSVTAAVSRTGPELMESGTLYQEAMEASRLRVFSGWGAILYAEQTEEQLQRTYRYPIQKEELLTDALMLGKMDEVKQLSLSILNSTEGHSYKDLNLTVFRLFFAVNMVADTLEKASGYSFAIQFNEVFAELAELERLSDISDSFLELLSQIEEKLGEKKSAKYEEMIRKIYAIIGTHYMREDFCLDSIADILNMSPVYLGRLIKKHTSKSITDYINEVRIEKAAELLATTDQLISDIARETGFAGTSYFGRVFKKSHGITPNEYRLKLRGGAG